MALNNKENTYMQSAWTALLTKALLEPPDTAGVLITIYIRVPEQR